MTVILFVSLGCLLPAFDGSGDTQPLIPEAQIPIEQIIAMTANAAQLQTQAFYTPTSIPLISTFTPTVTMQAAIDGKPNIAPFSGAVLDTGKHEDYRFEMEQEKIKELEDTGLSVEVKAYITDSAVENVIAYYRSALTGWKEEIKEKDSSNITAVRWMSPTQLVIINYVPDSSGGNENILVVKEIWLANNFERPTLINLYTAKDKDGKESTVLFGTTDTVYVFGNIFNAKKGNVVNVKWYTNNVGGNTSGNLINTTDLYLMEDDFYMTFSGWVEPPTNGWAIGGYNVEVYLNGVFNNMLYFSVK